jgi:hypothetical protein
MSFCSPEKHFEYNWHTIILGEKCNINDIVFNNIKDYVRRKYDDNHMLTVYDIRQSLQELSLSDLYCYSSYILSKITGLHAPNVSSYFYNTVKELFIKVVREKEKVLDNSRHYYPYYIYKIVDHLADDFETRRLLFYIRLPSEYTCKYYDQQYSEIIKNIPELEFKETNINEQLECHPSKLDNWNTFWYKIGLL